ncbi:MAG: iron ABC transporter permease [Thermodesulforhabdaceae bacterium]
MKKVWLFLLCFFSFLGALLIGPSDLFTPWDVIRWAFKPSSVDPVTGESIKTIVVDIRLPRAIIAFFTGAALSISGNSLQNIFKNPLVCPYVLGLSSGAAFGAALALATGFHPTIFAFLFGLGAVALSYFIALYGKHFSTMSLILGGIIVSGLFTAGLTFVQFLTDPFRLQTIVHWTMGNLHNSNWPKVWASVPWIALGSLFLYLKRWHLNGLALGDEEAESVGLNPTIEKLLIVIFSTVAAASSVSVAGIIGMVGLAVPHMVRLLEGADNRKVQPSCFILGGCFLLLVDIFSRSVTDFELPVGIFTTLIGTPLFVYLLKKQKIMVMSSDL